MSGPSITAGVRVYNAEKYIAETVSAILAQTHPPDEVVVVDDGSTDATPEVLAGFAGDIRVVRQPNRGLAATFNRVFEEARGDYVAISDADDIWVPERLERQVAALAEHPEIGIAFGAVEIFGTADGPWGYLEIGEPGLLERERFVRALLRADVISTSTTLIDRRLFEIVGPFEEHLGAEDYDYWIRALKAGAVFYYDPSVLAHYRRHDTQVTSSMLRVQRALYEVRTVNADVTEDGRFLDALLGENLFDIGRLLADAGEKEEARLAFRSCVSHTTAGTLATTLRALVWIALLTLPERASARASSVFVATSRALDRSRGGRPRTLT
jgi:glycosyltransferase involved in cell wall biosynthesis